MKKFLASILALTLCGLTAEATLAVPAAYAAEAKVTNVDSVTNVTGVTNVTHGANVTPPARINVPLWRYVSCYRAMDGSVWCWRYACTYFETVVLGCRDGWYRASTTWYA